MQGKLCQHTGKVVLTHGGTLLPLNYMPDNVSCQHELQLYEHATYLCKHAT